MTAGVPGSRPGVFATFRRGDRARPDGELLARVRSLRADVADMLGAHTATLVPADPSRELAPEALSVLAWRCVDRADAVGEPDGEQARRLCLLALDLQQVALEVYQHDLGVRTRRLADCADGLARLRALPSSADLLDGVCGELVRRCGFGRAVLSRVDGCSWKPATAYFSDDDESWFSGWVDQGITLDGLIPETRLLIARRPALVHDTENSTVHRPIIVDSGRSKSYVVAPLMHGGTVVGFLHADHQPSSRQADVVDRDVLWAFAEGFSRVYERTVLMERACAQRDQVGMILTSALSMMNDLRDPAIDGTVAGPARIDVAPDLTAREAQVLRLMVVGATNRAIAQRLVVAEDTVKSHVKHILRKLGVVNRAQAIARAAGTAPA
jgi:DNA-binding CsgD family transcriptional regulator